MNTREKLRLPLYFLLFLLIFALLSSALCFFSAALYPKEESQHAAVSPPFTVVLDAGHGGEDGGAVSASGICEKDINLSLALLLRDLLEANGIRVVMTRTTDVLLYDRDTDYHGRKKAQDLAARRKIAEETENALFVSIHMNAYPATQYSGLQVWYSPNDSRSEELAKSIQQSVHLTLQPDNNRSVKPATSSIYLLHHLTCPAVLVECGFLSNPEEAARLGSEDYQKELALLLFAAIAEAQNR